MSGQDHWPERCTLMGCTQPTLPGHHHHMAGGHLATGTCRCPEVAQPGTRPKAPA